MRLFIGINFEDKQKSYLKKMQNGLAAHLENGRAVSEENLHTTLLFLGDTPADKLEELCRALQNIAYRNSKFMTSFFDMAQFTNRCAVVKLKPSKGLLALQSDLAQTLAEYAKRNAAKYVPHATLYRDAKFTMPFKEVKKTISILNMPFNVDEITLFKSSWSATGTEYTPLTFFKLKD